MATKTTNYNLVKPSGQERVDISVINANMEAIDAAMKGLDSNKESALKGATEKTGLTDDDALPMMDHADGSKTKQIIFSNVKSSLKAYFDTLYNNKAVIANNLTTTEEGSALDAVQGKVLADRVSEVNSSLSGAKGQANGIATLDETTNVPVEQLGNISYLADNFGRKVQQINSSSYRGLWQLTDNYVSSNTSTSGIGVILPSSKFKLTSNQSSIAVLSEKVGYIELNGGLVNIATAILEKPIDVTYCNSVTVNFNGVSNGSYYEFGLVRDKTDVGINTSGYETNLYYRASTASNNTTTTLDVSGVTGIIYFKMGVWGTSYTKSLQIKNITVDKQFLPVDFMLVGNTIELADTKLTASLPPVELSIEPGFIDWYNLNALVTTPTGTSIIYDVYDNNDMLLKGNVQQGEILKLTNPIIKAKCTFARDTVDSVSPTMEWLELGMRGTGVQSDNTSRRVQRIDNNSYIGLWNLTDYYVNNSVSTSVVGQMLNSSRFVLTSNTSAGGILSEHTDYVELYTNAVASQTAVAIMDMPIDVTNLSTIQVKYSIVSGGTSRYAEYGLVKDKTNINTYTSGGYEEGTLAYTNGGMSEYTSSINVANITGVVYFKMALWGSTHAKSLKIYNISADKQFLPYKDFLYDFSNKAITLSATNLTATLPPIALEIQSRFIDWYNLNSLVITPVETSVKFDVYDNNNLLLKEDVQQGEILKLTNPIIKVTVTLTRDSLSTNSPTFKWLEVGMRGVTNGNWQSLGETTLNVDSLKLDIAVPSDVNEIRIQGEFATNTSSPFHAIFNDDVTNSYSYGYSRMGTAYSGQESASSPFVSINSQTSNTLATPSKLDAVFSDLDNGKRAFVKSNAGFANVFSIASGIYVKTDIVTKITLQCTGTYVILAGSKFTVWGR